MQMLSGKVALVTGAARGIGRAIAERLADEGADIALCDLQAEWMDDAAQAIEKRGRKALRLAADVSQSADVDKTVAAVVEAFGHVDILVNNAGITKDGLIMRMSDEQWDQVLAVNLRGTFLFTRAVSRPMMKQRSGVIVNIASIIGLIGNAGQCNYAASKAGVIAVTKSAAKELAPRGIRVNAIAPGFIESKMTEVLSEEVKRKMLEAIPMNRFGTATDVAATVAFLCGEGSAYITGQVLSVNGGMAM
jgi:3-oxoacyl-[acyl-carrier protein] reductase